MVLKAMLGFINIQKSKKKKSSKKLIKVTGTETGLTDGTKTKCRRQAISHSFGLDVPTGH